MTPIAEAPSLRTINGIGTTAYGSRDRDPETKTYVKTVWLTILFLPIVPLGAYRVAGAARELEEFAQAGNFEAARFAPTLPIFQPLRKSPRKIRTSLFQYVS